MSDRERRRDLEMLGLSPEAGDAELIAECQRRRALYSGDHPATYSLMSDEERRRLLSRIDGILSRVKAVGPQPRGSSAARPEPVEISVASVEKPDGPPPDARTAPGEFLRYSRLSRGLEFKEISKETKISLRHLQALEAEDGAALPVPVFVRGFIIAVARVLKLDDPEELARLYLEKLAGSAS